MRGSRNSTTRLTPPPPTRPRRGAVPAGAGFGARGERRTASATAAFHLSGIDMFDNLTQRLGRVVKTLRGEARLTEANIQDALREVRLALLEADVALPVVKDFIAAVKEKAVGEEVVGSLTPGQALVGVVHRELTALMGGAAAPLNLATQPPAVILMAGLQGAGKTTTAAKLAPAAAASAEEEGAGGQLPTSIVRRPSSSCRRWPRRSASTSSRRRRPEAGRHRRRGARLRAAAITTTC